MTANKIDVQGYLEMERELDRIVRVDETHVIISLPENSFDDEYDISLLSLQTPEQVVSWIFQLSEKSWVTRDILRRFIKVASNHAGIEL